MKKMLIIIGLLIIALLVAIQLIYKPIYIPKIIIPRESIPEIVTIKGEYKGTKGGGIVDGVWIPGYDVENGSQYIEKVVELKGELAEYPCPDPNIQCFGGPMMINIQSIKIIDE